MKFETYCALIQDLQKAGWVERTIQLGFTQASTFTPDRAKSHDYVDYKTGSLIELRPESDAVHVSFVSAGQNQGQGEGSRLMTIFTSLLDKHGLDSRLATYDQQSRLDALKRLYGFYKRFQFGFEYGADGWEDIQSERDIQDEDHLEGIPMYRKCQK